MNIVVLAGGTSTERDVSIVTSLNVCKALRKLGHNTNMLDVYFGTDQYDNLDDFFTDSNDLGELADNLRERSREIAEKRVNRKNFEGFFGENVISICKKADIVYIGLHGENGEDGRVQAAFDLLEIKYTGPGYLSSAVAMDKDMSKKVLIPEGVPMPLGKVFTEADDREKIEEDLVLPCVVKPACGGSSLGVKICRTVEEYKVAVEEAFALEPKIIVEEFVSGREFSVGVISGEAMPVVEIIPRDGIYDYKNKYDPDGAVEICPAEIPEEITLKMQNWAVKALEAAGIDTFARVDELMDENGRIVCLEINTLPGMTPTSLVPKEAEAMGLSYEELVQKQLDVSLDKYKEF